MSLHLDEYLATGAVPAPRHDLLTGRFACYDVYPCRDGEVGRGRGDRAALLRQPVPRARLRAVDRAPARRRGAGRDPRRLPRRVRHAGPRRLGRDSSGRPTPACRPSRRCPSSSTIRTSRPAHTFSEAHDAEHGDFRQVGWVLAGMDREQDRGRGARPDRSPTPTSCSRAAGLDDTEIAALASEGAVA